MFFLAALILIVIAVVHGARAKLKLEQRVELVLVYLLAVYHGFIMLGVALFLLLASERGAAMLSAPAGNVFQDFFGFAYLGMAAASILCIWLRGHYLVGPVVYWSLYFFGATYIHIAEYRSAARLTHHAISAGHRVAHAAPLHYARPDGVALGGLATNHIRLRILLYLTE